MMGCLSYSNSYKVSSQTNLLWTPSAMINAFGIIYAESLACIIGHTHELKSTDNTTDHDDTRC